MSEVLQLVHTLLDAHAFENLTLLTRAMTAFLSGPRRVGGVLIEVQHDLLEVLPRLQEVRFTDLTSNHGGIAFTAYAMSSSRMLAITGHFCIRSM